MGMFAVTTFHGEANKSDRKKLSNKHRRAELSQPRGPRPFHLKVLSLGYKYIP